MLKKFGVFTLALLFALPQSLYADTPPARSINSQTYDGSGTKPITGTIIGPKTGLDVNVINSSGGSTTADQGNPNGGGSASWWVQGSLGRTWSLLNTTDSVNVGNFPSSFNVGNFPSIQPVSQSGAWTTGRTWSLLNTTDSVNVGNFPSSFNVGNFPATFGATQSGAWSVGRTWALNSGTDSVTITGSISATNSANGNTGSTAPAQATQVGGVDGSGNLQALQVDTGTKLLKVDASGVPVPVTGTFFQATQPVSGTFFQATQPVSGTFFQATQPVSGNLGRTWSLLNTTDSVNVGNFPSTFGVTQSTSPWVVSGTVAATQSGAWSTGRTWSLLNTTDSVNVGNFPSIQPVSQSGAWTTGRTWSLLNSTDSVNAVQSGTWTVQQGSAPWSVSQSGAWTVGRTWNLSNGSDSVTTQQQADAAPATANVTIQDTASTTTAFANGQNFITGTPTINSAAAFALSSLDAVEVQVTGTWTGTVQTEVSMDGGTTWFTRGVKQTGSAYIGSSYTQNFEGGMNFGGMTNIRVRAVAAMTGTATVKVVASVNPASLIISNPLTLRDSTTQSIASTIKAASTAAAAADTSLVVALSPNSPQPASAGHTSVQLVRNDYSSTNVTTAAYVQLIASTSDTTNQLFIFDSSGQTLFLAVGAAASEVNKAYIVPGGNGELNLTIPAGSRVSVKAVSASATSGELSITLLK